MAQPTGSVLAPNLRMVSDFTGSTQAAYFIVRNTVMPQNYETNNLPGKLYPLTVDRQVEIATGTTLTEYWRVGETSRPAFATNPVETAGASTSTLSDNQTKSPTGNRFSGSGVYDEIKYCIIKWDFSASHDSNQCDVLSVAFYATNDSYGSGTGVELLKRETAAQRLYKDDLPCSAWHIMYALIESHEKILSENKPAVSLPVFGTPGTPVAP